MIHVALLRGVNVGGNNTVPMADLRRACSDLGLIDPATYINSGNVVFGATTADGQELSRRIEDAIEESFGFRCRVLVRSGADITAVASAVPDDWVNGPSMKADVVYLPDGLDPATAAATLAPRDGIDNVVLAPAALVWMVTRQDATRNGLLRLIGTDLYRLATLRNVNTARRLARMVAERSQEPGA